MTFPSRGRAALVASLAAVCLGANPAFSGQPSLQDFSAALQSLPEIVIYQAKEVVTLDSDLTQILAGRLAELLAHQRDDCHPGANRTFGLTRVSWK